MGFGRTYYMVSFRFLQHYFYINNRHFVGTYIMADKLYLLLHRKSKQFENVSYLSVM